MDPQASPDPAPAKIIKLWFIILEFIIVLVSLYVAGSAIYTTQTTGLLHVSSNNKNATLTISQINSQAKIIGVGHADIRLSPGIYQVAGVDNSYQGYTIVNISKKQTASINLDVSSSLKLPSEEAINFTGTNALIAKGLTNTQISVLKQEFFEFNAKAKTVAISTSSITPGPLKGDGTFMIKFPVKIDSTVYSATISYVGLNDMRLYLYDQLSNDLLYDSNSVAPSAN